MTEEDRERLIGAWFRVGEATARTTAAFQRTSWLPARQTPVVCQIHQRPEPDLPGDFKACGECWHVWRTEAEFRADLAQWHGDAAYTMDLADVAACPLCTHDL